MILVTMRLPILLNRVEKTFRGDLSEKARIE
jgi:hypothetical protein